MDLMGRENRKFQFQSIIIVVLVVSCFVVVVFVVVVVVVVVVSDPVPSLSDQPFKHAYDAYSWRMQMLIFSPRDYD